MVDVRDRMASAFAGPREAARDKMEAVKEQIKFIHSNAPSLTTGLLIGAMLIGAAGGYIASSFFTRWTVNAEWRDRIAAKSATVRNVIDTGNAEVTATDDATINALGDTDARLSQAETALRSIKVAKPASGGECRIPASGLRGK